MPVRIQIVLPRKRRRSPGSCARVHSSRSRLTEVEFSGVQAEERLEHPQSTSPPLRPATAPLAVSSSPKSAAERQSGKAAKQRGRSVVSRGARALDPLHHRFYHHQPGVLQRHAAVPHVGLLLFEVSHRRRAFLGGSRARVSAGDESPSFQKAGGEGHTPL